MTAAPSPILTKQQSKLPTSMRYERVQEILENDAAFRSRLGPKNHPVETRFGEKVLFSKETVDITEALHAEGKDAHKVPKNEVIRAAARLMRVMASNGEPSVAVTPPPPPPAPVPVIPQVKSTAVVQIRKKKTKAESVAKVVKIEPPKSKTKVKKAKPEQKIPVAKAEVKAKPAPVRVEPPTPPPAPTPVPESKAPRKPERPVVLEEQVPESELPPERQPLHFPKDFDPSKYPHFSVQNSIYCLLLSALSLAAHYEKFPDSDDRQQTIELALNKYLDTCNLLKLKTT